MIFGELKFEIEKLGVLYNKKVDDALINFLFEKFKHLEIETIRLSLIRLPEKSEYFPSIKRIIEEVDKTLETSVDTASNKTTLQKMLREYVEGRVESGYKQENFKLPDFDFEFESQNKGMFFDACFYEKPAREDWREWCFFMCKRMKSTDNIDKANRIRRYYGRKPIEPWILCGGTWKKYERMVDFWQAYNQEPVKEYYPNGVLKKADSSPEDYVGVATENHYEKEYEEVF